MSTERKWIVILTAAIVISAALGYGLASRRVPSGAAQSGEHPAHSAQEDRKVLYWHDPMVPNVKFDQPGKSPFMDMELKPVYADERADSGVRISPDVMQNLGIRLGTVERKILPQELDVVGSVVFDERLLEVVQARVEGYVEKLYVKAPLERVRKGQPLAEILAPAWLSAQQDYLLVLDASSESASAIRAAARRRLGVLGVPEDTIRALESEREPRATTTVRAPIDGVITELAVREGSSFTTGEPLLRINGLSTVWVNAQIPEAQVPRLTPRSTVEARAPAWPGVLFKGRVVSLLPDLDLRTRTLPVRLEIDNAEGKLSPGMFVSVSFSPTQLQPRLVVPSEAVIVTGERSVVIVASPDGTFDVVNVEVGVERNGWSTILSGLQEGQSIVLSGQFLIDSEASLKAAVDRLRPARGDIRGAARSYATTGVVTAISDERITLAHEPVPELHWGAMRRSFKAPPEGVSHEVQVGTQVRFSFSEDPPSGYRIRTIAPIDHAGHGARR